MAWAVIAALVLIQTTVNAYSLRHDRPDLESWKPFVWEYTSAAMTIPLAAAVGLLLRRAPPRRDRWGWFLAAHGLGVAAYCLLHVLGFSLLRALVYAALGQPPYRGFDLAYEFPKDAVSYLAWLVGFWIAGVASRRGSPQGSAPAVFAIRDGAKVLRSPVTDILAVTAAGNYVEFRLADARRPLMRTTLAQVEKVLEKENFVRTHRSWLVNAARVREIRPEGSGDFRIRLDDGTEAPLSRRFGKAAERLRGAHPGF